MKTKLSLFQLCAATALLLISITTTSAQILYSQLISIDPNRVPRAHFQLRQVNGDGSGDTAFGLPFASVLLPAWSRDGGLFAISAPDPNRPTRRSYDVYAINPANGAIQPITFPQELPPDPRTGAFKYTVSLYKSFSPDRSTIAVSSVIIASNGQVGEIHVTPVIEVFSTASGSPLALVRSYSSSRDSFTHHGGEGVDWHPAQNFLVAPVEASAPYQSDPSRSGLVTALCLLDPVDRAVENGRFRQITFPRANENASSGDLTTEHDYMPKFSPNGGAVAYVRSLQNLSFSRGGADPNVQSLRILNLNTGGETEVIRFQAGFYVSSLDWSPDGSALVFDLGQQETGNNGLQQNAIEQTNEIYIINTNSTGLRRLRGAGAAFPAWKPTGGQLPGALGNIATRMRVGTGDNAMIGGFIINGNDPKSVIIRGMGPSLGGLGVSGALSNPILELFQGNTLIATNDNWQQAPNANEIPNGFAPSDGRESVILTTLAPGTYTAVIRGVGGETGVGVVETYDLSGSSNSKLANFSTRGFVETGDNAMIGGFIATDGSSRVLLRAMGPSLGNAGIGNPLQDPTLQLVNGNGATVVFNDNWQQAPNANDIPNGFAPSDARESVVLTTLAPGGYTAIVRGVNDTTGVALVEAYHLQ